MVVATCVGAGDPVLEGRQFEVVVVDEATQVQHRCTLRSLYQTIIHMA